MLVQTFVELSTALHELC